MESPEYIRLLERYTHLKQMRSSHMDMLRDAQRYVSPNRASFSREGPFTSGLRTQDQDNSKTIYDSTPVLANQMFANGLSSYLIPKSDRWAYLKPVGTPSAELTDKELIFLENLSNLAYHYSALPESQFYTSSHETFQDLGAFGTGVVYTDRDRKVINYKSCPLADSYFDVNEEGVCDTMFYRRWLSTKAMIQQFPEVVNLPDFDPKLDRKQYELVYTVEKSSDIAARKGGRIGRERPFKVSYWSPTLHHIFKQTGKSYFPFIVPRWLVLSGEVMGHGIASSCMSQIRVLNKMVKELLMSAELSNKPPLVAEEDSLLLPLTYGSGQILYNRMGSPMPQPLLSGSQPNLTLDMLQDYRQQIQRAFLNDQIQREQKKERQSILEIQDERGQMLQQIGPMLARVEAEYVSPAVEHILEFLQDKRHPIFKEIPDTLQGRDMEIVYTSPAAHAQYASSISNMSAFIQDITPLLQQDPEMGEVLDKRNLLDNYGRMRNVPRNIIKSKEEVTKARDARQQAEQGQLMAQQAPQMAGAMKDIADARATDPEGVGQLMAL